MTTATQATPATAPLCQSCRHIDSAQLYCTHPTATRDPITGAPNHPAAWMRVLKNSDSDGPCGKAGRLFTTDLR